MTEHPGTITHPVVEALEAVSRVTVAFGDSLLGLSGRGTGKVTVRQDRGALVTGEEGVWYNAHSKGHPYTDSSLWRPDGANLELSHTRRGPGRPVPLLTLVPASDGFKSKRPHRCGKDVYRATVWLDGASIFMRWVIEGPAKRALILKHYY